MFVGLFRLAPEAEPHQPPLKLRPHILFPHRANNCARLGPRFFRQWRLPFAGGAGCGGRGAGK
jgi:hypothetical protein